MAGGQTAMKNRRPNQAGWRWRSFSPSKKREWRGPERASRPVYRSPNSPTSILSAKAECRDLKGRLVLHASVRFKGRASISRTERVKRTCQTKSESFACPACSPKPLGSSPDLRPLRSARAGVRVSLAGPDCETGSARAADRAANDRAAGEGKAVHSDRWT